MKRGDVNVDTHRGFETMNRNVNEEQEMGTEKNNQTLRDFVETRRKELGLAAYVAARRAGLHRSYWS
jgi:hypothetical protein